MIDGVTVTELSSARFIYNGWDIIAEYSVLNGSTLDKLQRTFAWGVDIAGSLADAGGVGALLQFVNSATGTAYLPSFDGNGNVASLINLGTGALAAAYEYSTYGEMLRDEIHDNAVAPFALRSSTKWRDAETGWLNYGRRYYDPRNGRFIGRDPIAEEGGINLYAFCGNNPVKRWDRLGMHPDIEIYEGKFYCPDDPYGDIPLLEDNDVTGPYGTDPSQYFGTYVVTSTMDGSRGSANWIGVDGTPSFETFESPFYDPIEVPVPSDAYYDDEVPDSATGGQQEFPRDSSTKVDLSRSPLIGQPNPAACVPTAAWNAAAKLLGDKVNSPTNKGLFDELACDALEMGFTSLSMTAIAFNEFARDSSYRARLTQIASSELQNMIESLSKGPDIFITTSIYEQINHIQLYVPDDSGRFQVLSSGYAGETPTLFTWSQDSLDTWANIYKSQGNNSHYQVILITMPPP